MNGQLSDVDEKRNNRARVNLHYMFRKDLLNNEREKFSADHSVTVRTLEHCSLRNGKNNVNIIAEDDESKQKHQWKMTNASTHLNIYKLSRRGRKLQVSDDARTLVALPKEVPERTCTHLNIYKLSRRGRKLQVSDDVRTLVALPKEVPERTWAEILLREENDLVVFDIREEIVEMALQTGYTRYMERQNALFTAHCAAQAWLKLIDWHFYRHDPGEEPSSAPACFIPKREQSWQPDALPEPSPKDTWGHHELVIVEDASDEVLVKWPSNSSIDMPVVEEIPEEYCASEDLVADSELLQKVTDYSSDDLSPKESAFSALKTTTPVDGSLQGAGDSKVAVPRTHHQTTDRSKSFSSRARYRPDTVIIRAWYHHQHGQVPTSAEPDTGISRARYRHQQGQIPSSAGPDISIQIRSGGLATAAAHVAGRSRALLQPLDSESKSRISIISDCRLRNL
ncbi:Uncharacterized protein OBRU01_04527, partial [Operophtera brumata]